jgi:hypothetical protein
LIHYTLKVSDENPMKKLNVNHDSKEDKLYKIIKGLIGQIFKINYGD